MKPFLRSALLLCALALACSSVAVAQNNCGWQQGEMVTYNQGAWGTSPSAANDLLSNSFGPIYFNAGGVLETGIPGSGGFSINFTGGSSTDTYLPSTGLPEPLTGDVVNPMTTASGIFGGNTVALELNIDFNDAGVLSGTSNILFGDLVLTGLTTPYTSLNGLTVREALVLAETVLGGGSGISPSDFDPFLQDLNNAFLNGIPSQWAQDHLKKGWSSNDFETYSQVDWGGDPGNETYNLAGPLFSGFFGNLIIVGGKYSMAFTYVPAIFSYLPAIGIPGPLTGNLINPMTTTSGDLGGEVLALTLNVGLSDAGPNSLRFGDLVINNYADGYMTGASQFNGMTVRQFLASANQFLGFNDGLPPIPINTISSIANLLNAAFINGVPSAFAQQYLFAPCNVNHCPATSSFNVSTNPNTEVLVAFSYSDADNEPLTFLVTQNPAHGTLIPDADGAYFYTPNTNFIGKDTIVFEVGDGKCTVEGSVYIDVVCSTNWQNGEMVTYGQGAWGIGPTAANNLLNNSFGTVYFNSGGVLETGIPGSGGFSITLTSGPSADTYLPSAGTPEPLTGDVVDPMTTASGIFGGTAVVLELNIDFNDAGVLSGTSNILFGDLVLTGLTTPFTSLNGLTVRQVLASAETVLGGGSAGISPSDFDPFLQNLNNAFLNGTPTQWAQDHLTIPCTPVNLCDRLNCDDGNACNGVETCNPSTGCVAGTPMNCNDGNACNGVESCNPSTGCTAGTPMNCDDRNACTTDGCNPQTGCFNTRKNCDDQNACTTDYCQYGSCKHTAKSCSDNNSCTSDGCNAQTGQCVYTPKNCDDHNACTTDYCQYGSCKHTAIVCNDNNKCTNDACSPQTGLCVYTPKVCNDYNACTTDGCVPSYGCKFTAIVCNDYNKCTTDKCVNGTCVFTPKNCGDGYPCTVDGCNVYTGSCYHNYISGCHSHKMDDGGEEQNQVSSSEYQDIKAYPNPFSDKLNIEFTMAKDSRVKLEIFSITGQRLAIVFDGDVKAAELKKLEYHPAASCDCMVTYRLQTSEATYYGKAVMVR